MGSFESLKQSSFNLYRGGNGRVSHAIMSVAVGPARVVAQQLKDDDSGIPNDLHDDVCATLKKLLLLPDEPDKAKAHCPFRRVKDCADWILRNPRFAANQLTPFEHVVWEETVNSPNTARLLESTSKNPQIGILYAYGILIEEWHTARLTEFYRKMPNEEVFIAVLASGREHPLAKTYSLNIAGEKFGFEECKRRIERDEEVLLHKAEKPLHVVPLPKFDMNDKTASLDAAADTLIAWGVAEK